MNNYSRSDIQGNVQTMQTVTIVIGIILLVYNKLL